jgi:hypothetical protein
MAIKGKLLLVNNNKPKAVPNKGKLPTFGHAVCTNQVTKDRHFLPL